MSKEFTKLMAPYVASGLISGAIVADDARRTIDSVTTNANTLLDHWRTIGWGTVAGRLVLASGVLLTGCNLVAQGNETTIIPDLNPDSQLLPTQLHLTLLTPSHTPVVVPTLTPIEVAQIDTSTSNALLQTQVSDLSTRFAHQEATISALQTVGAQITTDLPSITPTSTATETEPMVPTPTPQTDGKDVHENEGLDNNHRFTHKGPGIWRAGLATTFDEAQRLTNQTPEQQAEMFGIDSFLSSMVRPFGFDVNPRPEFESGMSLSPIDLKIMHDTGDVGELLNTTVPHKVGELGHVNENGIYTFGVFGATNDRGTLLAITALSALRYQTGTISSDVNGGLTLNSPLDGRNVLDVLWDEDLAGELAGLQQNFMARTQESNIGFSSAEQARRASQDPKDLDNLLPHWLTTIPDQHNTCEVQRDDSALTRPQENQVFWRVGHTDDGNETRSSANSENEGYLYVLAVQVGQPLNLGTNADVRVFTDRKVQDAQGQDLNQALASSMNQELPCDDELPIQAPATNTAAPEAPTNKPSVAPVVVSTDVPPSVDTATPPASTEVPLPTSVPPTLVPPTEVPAATNTHQPPTATQAPVFPTEVRVTNTQVPVAMIFTETPKIK